MQLFDDTVNGRKADIVFRIPMVTSTLSPPGSSLAILQERGNIVTNMHAVLGLQPDLLYSSVLPCIGRVMH